MEESRRGSDLDGGRVKRKNDNILSVVDEYKEKKKELPAFTKLNAQ